MELFYNFLSGEGCWVNNCGALVAGCNEWCSAILAGTISQLSGRLELCSRMQPKTATLCSQSSGQSARMANGCTYVSGKKTSIIYRERMRSDICWITHTATWVAKFAIRIYNWTWEHRSSFENVGREGCGSVELLSVEWILEDWEG